MWFGVYNSKTNHRRVDRFWDEDRMCGFVKHHPEMIVWPLTDPKWERMLASVGHHEYDIDTNTYDPPLDWCEFYIEVYYEGMTHYYRQLVHKDTMGDFTFDIYAFMLNEMVAELDRRLSCNCGALKFRNNDHMHKDTCPAKF